MTTLRQALDRIRPGMTVYVPGATGEALALRAALAAEPDRLDGVRLVGCPLPGMNEFDYAALHPNARATVFMLPEGLRPSFEAGRVEVAPLAYSRIAAWLAAAPIDIAFVQVAPADQDGRWSLGLAADFAPIVLAAARTRVALVNPTLPRPAGGARAPASALDLVVEAAGPVVMAPPARPAPQQDLLARRVAELVPDRASLQTGIGGAPAALYRHLGGHRGLILRSGMATEGLRAAFEAGAMDRGAVHRTGVAYGPADFYDWLAAEDVLAFADVRVTHDAATLAQASRFTAVNAALEVDLFGQVNLEWRDGRLSSGVGGAPDFMRAAARAPDGLAITALLSTARGGTVSRIVPRLTGPTVSIARHDVDVVATEHGAARLGGLSMDRRAEALIAVADPAHRDGLAQAWEAMRRGL
ncbi:acetyl-CoA hydrolase [Caulobacter sp. CCUG 60055]|uniref:acetyl-CoA hydrolase/transferase family protein n=1 Tax=Caulobacter sp. CCUG 60055 TaxID=2100090 RepID=UPI001FA7251C|nr:acetyl-CoA hydrolase [Caulobacter sp. CCUG 60055]